MNSIRKHINVILESEHAAEREHVLKTMCSHKIGEGNYRDVYYHKDNYDSVVKVEKPDEDASEHNHNEYLIWQAAQGTPLEEFLAPITWISKHKSALTQWVTSELDDYDLGRLPERIPRILAAEEHDTSYLGNWSSLLGPGGRIVCHDFGHIPPELVSDPKQQELVKVEFDEENYMFRIVEDNNKNSDD